MRFITKNTFPRRTFLRGMGVTMSLAAAGLDGRRRKRLWRRRPPIRRSGWASASFRTAR